MGFGAKKRNFSRKQGERSYKPIFYLSCEGEKTEIEYFGIANRILDKIIIKADYPRKGSNPTQVLRHMTKNILAKNKLKDKDEAWLIIDEDQWDEHELKPLSDWQAEHQQGGIAMSIPQFEIWLLLHFSDEMRKLNQRQCLEALAVHLPNYIKSIPAGKIHSRAQIENAIKREKQRYRLHLSDGSMPRFSSVGAMMERMLQHG